MILEERQIALRARNKGHRWTPRRRIGVPRRDILRDIVPCEAPRLESGTITQVGEYTPANTVELLAETLRTRISDYTADVVPGTGCAVESIWGRGAGHAD